MRKLFNYVDAPEEISTTSIVDGKTDGVMDPNKYRYKIFNNIYELGVSNDWTTTKDCDFSKDKYYDLNENEKRMFDLVYSQLIFMDSIKTNNDMEVSSFITSPECIQALSRVSYEESNHSQAYYNNIEAICDDPSLIYNMWKTDSMLRKKNEFIGNLYEEFGKKASEDDESLEYRCKLEVELYKTNKNTLKNYNKNSFDLLVSIDYLEDNLYENYLELCKKERMKARIKVVIANRILEGIYFLSGFICIFALGRIGKMLGSVTNIRFINRDEKVHLPLYGNIFKYIKREYPQYFDKDMYNDIRQMFIEGSQLEIEWGKYILNDSIFGLKNDDLEEYIKYLTNKNVRELGIINEVGEIYPGSDKDPLPWVDKFSSFNDTKTDFFTAKVQNYDESGLKFSEDDV